MSGQIKHSFTIEGHDRFLVVIREPWAEGANPVRLDPSHSQGLRNHSPDGFAWGYGGSGPSQLALAILLLFLTEDEALRYYQQFKFDVVACLPTPNFTLGSEEVWAWIEANVKDS